MACIVASARPVLFNRGAIGLENLSCHLVLAMTMTDISSVL